MNDIPDIDIEVANHAEAVAALPTATPACQFTNGMIRPHNSGIYLQQIPVNPLNGMAVFPYVIAEELGFYKVDLLTNSVYQNFISQEDLHRILNEPIDWSWFKHRDFVSQLFHFGAMADTVVQYAPQSISDLACLIAIKNPGKRYLMGQPWDVVREKIWTEEPPAADGKKYKFKKAHGVAYAIVVTVDARLKAPRFFDTIIVA